MDYENCLMYSDQPYDPESFYADPSYPDAWDDYDGSQSYYSYKADQYDDFDFYEEECDDYNFD